MALPLQMRYNQATQIRWPGERSNVPRPWPTGGDPVDVHDSTIPLDDKAIARFWAKVDRSGGPDACWPWTACVGPHGYGLFQSRSRTTSRAHRVAYAMTHGNFDARLFVCHRCDNPPCCNPAHLWLGTTADNVADMVAKGRQATGDQCAARLYPERLARGDANGSRKHPERLKRGEDAGQAKLLTAQVNEIIEALLGGASNVLLARRFGVHRSTIANIRHGRRWAHIPRPWSEQ